MAGSFHEIPRNNLAQLNSVFHTSGRGEVSWTTNLIASYPVTAPLRTMPRPATNIPIRMALSAVLLSCAVLQVIAQPPSRLRDARDLATPGAKAQVDLRVSQPEALT